MIIFVILLIQILFCNLNYAQSIDKNKISSKTSYYPRTIQLQDSSYLTCVTNLTKSNSNPNYIHRELSIYKSIDLINWIYLSAIWSVEYDPNSNNITDLDNCNIIQSSIYLSSKMIIAAFRYHTGCFKYNNNPELYCTQYSLQSSISYNLGINWSNKLSMIVSLDYKPPFNKQPPGLWEPFLFQPDISNMNINNKNNCFDVFNGINNLNNSFMVYYSEELYRSSNPNLLQQDIRMKYTNNNGISWSGHEYIICNVTNSRNGMPGITQLIDNSLFIVMEGFWSKYGWGYFTVNSMRSFDCSKTWTQKYVIYEPNNKSYNAGAPDTIMNKNNGFVYVSFMSDVPPFKYNTNIDWPDSTWPANAYIRIIKSNNNGSNGMELIWDYNNIEVQSSINSYWSNLFVKDNNKIYVEYQQNSECYVNAQPC